MTCEREYIINELEKTLKEIKMTFERDYMMNELTQRECRVVFKKTNGEERDMMCTLQESVVPPATKSDSLTLKKVREVNEQVIPVWDVNKEAWRSFRVDSVTSFS